MTLLEILLAINFYIDQNITDPGLIRGIIYVTQGEDIPLEDIKRVFRFLYPITPNEPVSISTIVSFAIPVFCIVFLSASLWYSCFLYIDEKTLRLSLTNPLTYLKH